MKKILAVIFSAALALLMTASAFAVGDIPEDVPEVDVDVSPDLGIYETGSDEYGDYYLPQGGDKVYTRFNWDAVEAAVGENGILTVTADGKELSYELSDENNPWAEPASEPEPTPVPDWMLALPDPVQGTEGEAESPNPNPATGVGFAVMLGLAGATGCFVGKGGNRG